MKTTTILLLSILALTSCKQDLPIHTITCDTDSSAVCVLEKGLSLYVPRSISPNNDGINDRLTIEGSGFELDSIQIFNRFGEKVFQSKNINNSWEGEQTNDNYVGKLNITTGYNEAREYLFKIMVITD